jgi:hypothetical protein
MINKLILSLYDYYRRKNDPVSAAFHTKVLASLSILMLLTSGYFLISLILGWKVSFDASGMKSINLKFLAFGLLAVILVLVWFSTDSYKVLESHRHSSEATYRKYFFVCFYVLIPVILYLIATAR